MSIERADGRSIASALKMAGPANQVAGQLHQRRLQVLAGERAGKATSALRVDVFVPGCPPSAPSIYYVLTELIAGRMPKLTGGQPRFG